jgi:hypothetical protein
VRAQDGGTPVAQSRKEVAGRHGLSERQLLLLEQQGLDGDWPPLGSSQQEDGAGAQN